MPRYVPRNRLAAQEKSLAESADLDKRLDNAILDERQRELDKIASKESPVAAGMDRGGMPPLTGVVGSLAELETQSRHRLSPRRNRWADGSKFDDRAAEFDARHTEVTARLTPLPVELANAGNTDAQALSDWIANGEQGPRPKSIKPALEEQIAELKREADALIRASTDTMAAKAEYVTKHRSRLARDARRHVERAAGHLAALIAEVEQARDELATNREAELWALTYPGDAASAMPPFPSLAGGLKQIGERLGVRESIAVDRVFVALRDDAAWLKDCASPEQRAEITGTDPRKANAAVWVNSPEFTEQDRREKAEARERYRQMWGTDLP